MVAWRLTCSLPSMLLVVVGELRTVAVQMRNRNNISFILTHNTSEFERTFQARFAASQVPSLSSLPKATMQCCPARSQTVTCELNRKSDVVPIAPPHYLKITVDNYIETHQMLSICFWRDSELHTQISVASQQSWPQCYWLQEDMEVMHEV